MRAGPSACGGGSGSADRKAWDRHRKYSNCAGQHAGGDIPPFCGLGVSGIYRIAGRSCISLVSSKAFFHANSSHTQALLAERVRIEASKKAFIGVKNEIQIPSDPPTNRSSCENQMLQEIAPGHRSAGYVNS